MLLNSVSHVIYDVHLEGFLDKVPTVKGFAVEFFELKGHVYSVFAKDSKVIIYKDYQQVGVVEYSNGNVKPIELLFDRASQSLILLAEVEGKYQSFLVDVLKQELSEGTSIKAPSGLKEVKRTKRYFALQLEDSVSLHLATDLAQHVALKEARSIETSILDDVVLVTPFNEETSPRFFNIDTGASEVLSVDPKSGCFAFRARESESLEDPVKD